MIWPRVQPRWCPTSQPPLPPPDRPRRPAYGGHVALTRTLMRVSTGVSLSPHSWPPLPSTGLGHEVVLIPVKAFSQAKRRLGASMSDQNRVELVRAMAGRVVAACAPLPAVVVCDDPEVARWATQLGAAVMWEPGRGLNGAVRSGVDQLAAVGVRWVTVAHGDLPRARDLGSLAPFDGVTLVPDRRDDGTNVLRLPVAHPFRFAYGPGSFHRHRVEAGRLGLPVRVLRIPTLAYDVDWPSDVEELSGELR
jgi:2-phospho-L-lactate/phosphoenolpyruvate guanylyltransferase